MQLRPQKQVLKTIANPTIAFIQETETGTQNYSDQHKNTKMRDDKQCTSQSG